MKITLDIPDTIVSAVVYVLDELKRAKELAARAAHGWARWPETAARLRGEAQELENVIQQIARAGGAAPATSLGHMDSVEIQRDQITVQVRRFVDGPRKH
jgi:hypothetical protein